MTRISGMNKLSSHHQATIPMLRISLVVQRLRQQEQGPGQESGNEWNPKHRLSPSVPIRQGAGLAGRGKLHLGARVVGLAVGGEFVPSIQHVLKASV